MAENCVCTSANESRGDYHYATLNMRSKIVGTVDGDTQRKQQRRNLEVLK